MTLRRTIVAVLVLYVMASLGAIWTAVWLQSVALDAIAEQTIRAEARTEQVRNDVNKLLEEIRDPADDTRRSELWRTADRIEAKVDEILQRLDEE